MATLRHFLWFDADAKAARDFYLTVFKDAKALGGTRLTDWVSGTRKTVPIETFDFQLEGMRFTALNAGPNKPFNERVSLYIETRDQRETDYYWNALIADGGRERPCGWLTDKFGVYWQVIPEITLRLMGDADREKADRARQAMYGMHKIVIADLEAAFEGRA
jgi:predicted 3-demethylubiquinone-9 3-methyltransferase (glyoxalase superfamily)